MKKIAVFDLDGTLWKENSHYAILNAYYKTSFYSSFAFRFISHFFRKSMYAFICKQYDRIPKDFSSSFELAFVPERLALIEDRKSAGFFCVIVSNAPYEIVRNASERLGIPFIRAPVGKKEEYLKKEYEFDYLFVCTDNIEDEDLLDISNERKIIVTGNNRKFMRRKYGVDE